MDSNPKTYDHIASAARIDGILAQPQGNYEERDSLPDRSVLTYTNGFYAKMHCAVRGPPRLVEASGRLQAPLSGSSYRAFISETVAIFNSDTGVREINIVGDCVWAVYNTPYKRDIDGIFSLACKTNSLLQILNYKLARSNYKTPIRAGIGLAWGRALMIKAGYSGSGLQDVVYMGDVVNRAAKFAARGSKTLWTSPIMIDSDFASNLNDHNRALTINDYRYGCHTADAVDAAMSDWYEENCK